MKATTRDNVLYSELANEHSFTMEMSPKAFYVFSSQLYKNKIRAIIRELSCNAVDAHKEVGTTESFEVKLPSYLNSEFWIRDFGPGISEQDMYKVFVVFFKSTKENTNEMTGMLGLGSKSPFSYAESFTVTSYQNGIEKTYIAFMGTDRVPTIDKVFEGRTKERNGLKIQFGVLQDDLKNFEREARYVYSTFFDIKPDLSGASFSIEDLHENFHWYCDNKVAFKPHYGSNNVYAIQGDIAYPIDIGKLNTDFFEHYTFPGDLYIRFDIGLITFTPSREEMEDTIYNTQAIDDFFDKSGFRQELDKKIDDLIASITTQYEACRFYQKQQNNGGLEFTSKTLKAKLQVKNFKYYHAIDFDLEEDDIYDDLKLVLVNKANRKKKGFELIPSENSYYKVKIYLKEKVKYSSRAIETHIRENSPRQYLIVKNLENLDLVEKLLLELDGFSEILRSSDLVQLYGESKLKETVSRKLFKREVLNSDYELLEEYKLEENDVFTVFYCSLASEENQRLLKSFQRFLVMIGDRKTPLLVTRSSSRKTVQTLYPNCMDIEEFLKIYYEDEYGKQGIREELEKYHTNYALKNTTKRLDIFRSMMKFIPEKCDYKYKEQLTKLVDLTVKETWIDKLYTNFPGSSSESYLQSFFNSYFTPQEKLDIHDSARKEIDEIYEWYERNLPVLFDVFNNYQVKYLKGEEKERFIQNFEILLGSLLLEDSLKRLDDKYMTNKEEVEE